MADEDSDYPGFTGHCCTNDDCKYCNGDTGVGVRHDLCKDGCTLRPIKK